MHVSCLLASCVFLLSILLAFSCQIHPLSFIFLLSCEKSRYWLKCKILSRFQLSAAFRALVNLKMRHKWEQAALMPEIISLPCYHLSCAWKRAKKIRKPRGKVLNDAEAPPQRENQHALLCGKIWMMALSGRFDSLQHLPYVFIKSILVVSLSEFAFPC